MNYEERRRHRILTLLNECEKMRTDMVFDYIVNESRQRWLVDEATAFSYAKVVCDILKARSLVRQKFA